MNPDYGDTSMGVQRKNWCLNAASLISFVLLLITVLGLQKQRLQSITSTDAATLATDARNDELKSELQLTLLQSLPDFGFANLIADWVFLNFVQYFGNFEYRQETGYGLSGDYFDIIIERDPYAYLPYQYISSSVSLFAADPQRAVALQEKGLQSLSPGFPPKSYFIWRHKGIDEILFLDDYEAAAHSHEMAADWAAESSDPRAVEDQYSLRRTAKFLSQDPDRTEAQVRAWVQVLQSAPDAKTQAVAIESLRALGIEITRNEDGTLSLKRVAPE
jgi:hypothetical protein